MHKNTAPSYNRAAFPFAGIFADLTTIVNQLQYSPLQAYVWYQNERRRRGLNTGPDYCSTAITNGGHAHIPTIAVEKIIERNTTNAQQLVGELVSGHVLNARTVIVPADLGYIPHWGQSDYLMLWLSVIAGLGLTDYTCNKFDRTLSARIKRHGVDFNLMNDRIASPQKRAPEYFRFAEAFVQACASLDAESHPAHRVINLIDTQDSLGSQTERIFARRLNIPVYDVQIAGDRATAQSVFRNPQLREDLETIVRYGGTTLEFLPGNTFVLRETQPMMVAS